MAGSSKPPKPLKLQPLWARVDSNRTKLAVFIGLFTVGSALILDLAFVAVPGSLLSLVFAEDSAAWFTQQWLIFGLVFIAMLVIGFFIVAVQLSNAEDWVANRFPSVPALDIEMAEPFREALADMSLAAGLDVPPKMVILVGEGTNALAVGTNRGRALVGISERMLDEFTPDELRAVLATLVARICAGDILFGTALAALMGPLRLIRESGPFAADAAATVSGAGCEGIGCLVGDSDDASGCLGAMAMALFLALVALLTYLAVVSAAWIVTLWGRALHRTGYEKADAEGMLLLKDPAPMLSALRKAIDATNAVSDGDQSYDGILYVSISGKPGVDKREKRRYDRLREVLGTEGLAAPDADISAF